MPNAANTIAEIASLIEPVATKYGVKKLTVFGSFARGSARLGSDVDIRIADRGTLRGLFRLAAFQADLERALGRSVDILPTDAFNERFLARIRDEEIVVYDAPAA